MEYMNLPYEAKISRPLFIGEIQEVGEDYAFFKVISSGKQWHRPISRQTPIDDQEFDHHSPGVGETYRVKYQDYGSCGKLHFKVGEYWLYAGSDLPFSATVPLTAVDLGDDHGADIGAVIKRVAHRIGSKLLEPLPSKETPFIPGHFVWKSDEPSDQRQYDLLVSPLDPQMSTYRIEIDTMSDGGKCHVEGTAPPYGYGEIVFIPQPHTAADAPLFLKGCKLLLVQYGGKVTVEQGNTGFECEKLFNCDQGVYITSPGDLTPLP
jgi:hypothetical protein